MLSTSVRRVTVALSAGALLVGVAACSSSSPKATTTANAGSGGSGTATATASWDSATSLAAGGGMASLVAAAKKEGTLNVITLPRDWAGYGALLDGFTAEYGIKINSENPDGSSGDEISAVKSTKGQPTAPDVLDVGLSYALSGAQDGLYAPYKVATWDDIPTGQKDVGGLWWSDYGGYISIGCNPAKVGGTCPKTLKDLDNPAYAGKVALNGDPTSANAAFQGVWAAALANGGSATNIQPGIDFFAKLKKAGIFIPVAATSATIQSGATPIVLNWDYLNVAAGATLKTQGVTWQTNVPTDGLVSGYYAQAISINAAHPAAARLWEEYLYSTTGQNGWLKGYARPIELATLVKDGTADKTALAALPVVNDPNPFLPTQDQTTAAKNVVTQKWAAATK
jgi:putative spermidine/putrescine transport system substrate-binding protein